MLILLTNLDKKIRNRIFDCNFRSTGDKWQSKTLLLAIFLSVFIDCKKRFDRRLSGAVTCLCSRHCPFQLKQQTLALNE